MGCEVLWAVARSKVQRKKRENTDKNNIKVVKLHKSNQGRSGYKTPKNKTPTFQNNYCQDTRVPKYKKPKISFLKKTSQFSNEHFFNAKISKFHVKEKN